MKAVHTPTLPRLTHLPPGRPQIFKTEKPEQTDQLVGSNQPGLPPHPARLFQARADRVIDCTFNVLGLLGSAAACGLAGAIGGALAGSLLGPTGAAAGLAVGGAAGAISGGWAYSEGYGETLGKGAMALAAVGLGALLGSLGGSTGAVIGASLGTAYAAAGLYFSQE